MADPRATDQFDNPFQPRRPGGWTHQRVSIKETWGAVLAERKARGQEYVAPTYAASTKPAYRLTGRFERPSSSGSSTTSEISTTSTQLPARRLNREYPFVKRWLESNTLEEYKAACAAAAAAKSAELAEERNRSIEGQVRIGKLYVAEQFGGDRLAAEQYIKEQSTEEQFVGFSGAQLAAEELVEREYTGDQSFDERFVDEQHSGTQSFQEQQFRDRFLGEQQIPVQSIEDQHTQEQHAELESSGWNPDSEFDTELTVSSRLNVRYIPDESPRDTLRKLSRLLSQSPASRSIADIQATKSPEKETVFESSAPKTTPTPFTAKLESLKSPKLETVIQPPATEADPTPFAAITESLKSPNMETVAQHPASATTSTPLITKTEASISPKLETTVPTPAPNSDPIQERPDPITTLARLEDASMEDSTLDAFQSFQEQMPSTTPTTFEQYFSLQVEERERLIDEAVRVRMNNRFNQTKHGLREAKRGIGRLDDFISSMPSAPATVAVDSNSVAVTVSNSKETLFSFEVTSNNNTIEQHCSMKYPSWSKLWTTQTESSTTGRFAGSRMSRKRQLTWLGLILAIFAAWYLIETVMCGIYCHPENSSKNTWHPSDPFFPWALPTKVDQWTGEVFSGSLKVMKLSWDNYRDPEGKRYRPRGWQRVMPG
ncbi:uncharacterized protein RSE6_08924 [Rhynchosporium secalis]|uniref:Uncharacterized protein n=1 Tax=Rhynchosporium secalis TaxID=38038 RepID=A0A1E1MGM2_RHYSE|nr:uncharacterized protein RSE6_08924 [Rhynchosporium secalis]